MGSIAYEILSFTAQSAVLSDAAQVYATVWERSYEESLFFFRHYVTRPHFYGYVAVVDEALVGMVFGTASLPGQWWHDKVAQHVGATHPALQGAWIMTELAVLEAYRNQKIGRSLHDSIIQAQPFPNLLLSTQDHNKRAQHFYQGCGWHYLHAGVPFQFGRSPYVVMCQSLTR